MLRVPDRIHSVATGATILQTCGPGDAERLAREAVLQGFQTVVAAGGDGTVNEVLRGMADSGVRLGVIPLGTMNVFARELGLPMDWEAAWRRILGGGERRTDVVRANGMPMAQLGGVGFDARALARVSPSLKRSLGPAAYVWAGLQELRLPMRTFSVHAEGYPPLEAVWVVVGTGRFYGGPFPVFPGGRNGDGRLKVLVVRDLTILRALRASLSLALGWHTRLEGITYLQASALRIEGRDPAGPAPALELDGELMGSGSVEFRVEPLALRVAV